MSRMTELAAAAGWRIEPDRVLDGRGKKLAEWPADQEFELDTILFNLLSQYLREATEALDEYVALLRAEEAPKAEDARVDHLKEVDIEQLARARIATINRVLGEVHNPDVKAALMSESWALGLLLQVLGRRAAKQAPKDRVQIPSEIHRKILQLVHPDAQPEGRRDLATEVTSWLNTHR